MLKEILADFQKLKNPIQAKNLARFFKTGKGEYGEGDIFLGIKVPEQRKLVGKYYKELSLQDTEKLIASKIHEQRLTGLLILVAKYKKTDPDGKNKIYKLYLKNAKNINNWDLVDLSAPNIVGNFLLEKDRKILYKFSKSKNLWERRISILATFEFIRNKQFADSLKIAEILLHDKHDLIHKAVGWMLRELGKRDQSLEEQFLEENSFKMPRTMLRYAIEKFPENKRLYYLNKDKISK
jgi:3-methyladenine DNA glycosylase AlkD